MFHVPSCIRTAMSQWTWSALRGLRLNSAVRSSARFSTYKSASSQASGSKRASPNFELVRVVVNDGKSEGKTNEGASLSIDYNSRDGPHKTTILLKWLRDHCRSDALYNRQTNQRKDCMTNLGAKAQLRQDVQATDSLAKQGVRVHDGNTIQLNWADGHDTTFTIETLLSLYHLPSVETDTSPLQELWSADNMRSLPTVKAGDSEAFARAFVKFGVVAVDGIDHKGAAATKELCHTIAPFHTTFYEEFWVFSNETQEERGEKYHEDTAYTNEALGPHTDGTYLEQTPGIQVFHCLQPAESGGDTILVDGFHAVKRLQLSNPEAFHILTKTIVPHHYVEGDGTIDSRCDVYPVIRLHPDGRIHQVRFNPYDRAPFKARLGTTVSDMADFYKSYEALARLMNKESASVQVPLRPGTVLFIDNYRVLHGRTAFSGYRQLCGCYLSRDAFLSRARRHIPLIYRHHVS